MSARITQRRYAALGKCEQCGEDAPASATLCEVCLARHNGHTLSLKARHQAAGRCVWCGRRNRSGLRACNDCRERYNAQRRARHAGLAGPN